MAQVNRRQWERFAYPTEFRLTATGHVLPAKLVDLSQRGMQVIVPVKLHPGNSIRGELPTPGAALSVTGRVCWVAADRTDGSAQTRAGIAFDPLPEATEQALYALAIEHPGDSVLVHLPGNDDPVRASAVRTDDGIRLSFALPFLRAGSIVTLQPPSASAEAAVARVVHTHVYAGATGAETRVQLLVQPSVETRKRRFVQYDAANLPPDHHAHTAAAVSDNAESLTVPKRRLVANLGVALALTAALWLGVQLARQSDTDLPRRSETDQNASKPLADGAAIAAPSAAPAAPTQTSPAPSARSTGAVPLRAPGAAAPAHSLPTPKPAADTGHPKLDRAPSPTPKVTTANGSTEIFVPVNGSLVGLDAKLWTDPPAVAVDLPHGTVALPRARYDLEATGVAGLSVGRPSGRTQLRVYVNSVLTQYEANAAPGGVVIRLKHDLQSPPPTEAHPVGPRSR